MKSFIAVAALFCGLLTAGSAAAQPAKTQKLRLYAGAAYFLTSSSFDQSVSYPENQETTTATASFSRKKGAGFDGSLEFDFSPNVGIAVGFHSTSRKNEVEVTASVPHPFFFNQPRTGTATTDVAFSEQAIHLDLVLNSSGNGRVGFSIFAGPTYFRVDTQGLARVDYTSLYPHDEITVNGIEPLAIKKNKIGFNAGAGVDFWFSGSVGIGLRGRYSTATISEGGADVKAGGLSAGGGLTLGSIATDG